MEDLKEEKLGELKRKACKIGLIFLGLMLLLTMISRTIYTLLLPEVQRDLTSPGAIKTEIYSSGKIGFDELMIDQMKVSIKASKEGFVTACYVKENDQVKKGDPLLEIEGDTDDEKQVEEVQTRNEIEINVGAAEREKENIKEQCEKKEKELSDKKAMLKDFTDDYDIIDIEQQIMEKQQEVTNNEALYEAGALSQNERDKSKDNLKLLKEKRDLLKEEHDTKINENIKEIQEKIDELNNSLAGQDEKIEIEKNKLLVLDKKQGKKVLYSPINGVVYELKIGVGATALQSEEVLVIIPDQIPITLTFSLDQQLADQTEIASKVIWTQDQKQRKGEVIKKTYDKEKEDTIITCQIDQELVKNWITDYKTYKSVNVSMTHTSDIYECLVPTGAISFEGQSAYVYTLEEKDTIFEKQYVVHKEPVKVIEEGDETSAVDGIRAETTIVVASNKLLKDNAEVRLQ